MAVGKTKTPLEPAQVCGAKYLDKVFALLARLRHDGCARDKAGNRTLFYDHYASLVLLSMFSPAMDSLRAIQQASALAKVQKLFGTDRRFSLGSLSESARVFDPTLLEAVVAELGRELLPLTDCYDPRLAPVRQDLRRTVTLVDGALLKALPRLVESMWTTSRSGNPMHGWRLHCQFDLGLGVPSDVELTDYRNSKSSDEREVLRRHLEAGRCYVMDRGYFSYGLFDAISLAGSDYVCRVKKSIAYEVVLEREVDAAGREAGVTRDVVVRAGCNQRIERRANHAVRLVYVEAEVRPRAKRGSIKPTGPAEKQVLILATNMPDVPAEVVALLYKYRWTVELFFRFFKQVMGCRHLLSDAPDGVRIQCYCAVIACMLLALWTGRKADKSTWRVVGWFLCGMAEESEVLAHLTRPPENRGVKLAAKEALWKKLGL